MLFLSLSQHEQLVRWLIWQQSLTSILHQYGMILAFHKKEKNLNRFISISREAGELNKRKKRKEWMLEISNYAKVGMNWKKPFWWRKRKRRRMEKKVHSGKLLKRFRIDIHICRKNGNMPFFFSFLFFALETRFLRPFYAQHVARCSHESTASKIHCSQNSL